MAFKRHFARVGAAERCTESIFTDHQRQVCDYALVYAEKKNDGEAPYSVSFTATQSGDVIVQLHPHSQLERAVRHERQAHDVVVARLHREFRTSPWLFAEWRARQRSCSGWIDAQPLGVHSPTATPGSTRSSPFRRGAR